MESTSKNSPEQFHFLTGLPLATPLITKFDRRRHPFVSRPEMTQLRRSLGLTRLAPLPRCPARSVTRARRLAAEGDTKHMRERHCCSECGCQYVAGAGTDHYGYGWCYIHEIARPRALVGEFAAMHKAALQAHHPFSYSDASAYLDTITQEANRAAEILTVDPEFSLIRMHIQEILTCTAKGMRLPESTRRQCNEIVQGVRDIIASGSEQLGEKHVQQLVDMMQKLEASITTGLTEKGGAPMTDEVRFRLIANLTTAVGKIAGVKLKIEANQYVSKGEMQVFFANLLQIAKRHMPSPQQFSEFVKDISKMKSPVVVNGDGEQVVTASIQ